MVFGAGDVLHAARAAAIGAGIGGLGKPLRGHSAHTVASIPGRHPSAGEGTASVLACAALAVNGGIIKGCRCGLALLVHRSRWVQGWNSPASIPPIVPTQKYLVHLRHICYDVAVGS